jgi:hypothetical protein
VAADSKLVVSLPVGKRTYEHTFNYRHLWMRLNPGSDSLGAAILEQIHRAAPVQIDHDGVIGVPIPFGPIVDADDTRS